MTETLSPVLGEATIEELRQAIRGPIVTPEDEGYDEARAVWNGLHDGRPALVVQPTGAADVAAAVGFARSHDLPIAVRGGGHSIAGFSTVRRRDRDRPLEDARRPGRPRRAACVRRRRRGLGRRRPRDPGARARDNGRPRLDHRRRRVHARRRDRLADAQARARVRQPARRGASSPPTAGSSTHPSRRTPSSSGACGAAAATSGSSRSSSSQLHPVGPIVYAGPIFYPADDAGALLRLFRDWSADTPDDVTGFVTLMTAPPLPVIPERMARQEGGGVHRRLRGAGGRRRGDGRRLPHGRRADRRPARADAVHDDPVADRPALAQGDQCLLQGDEPGLAGRRPDRRVLRAAPVRAGSAVRDPRPPDGRRGRPRARRAQPPSPSARCRSC